MCAITLFELGLFQTFGYTCAVAVEFVCAIEYQLIGEYAFTQFAINVPHSIVVDHILNIQKNLLDGAVVLLIELQRCKQHMRYVFFVYNEYLNAIEWNWQEKWFALTRSAHGAISIYRYRLCEFHLQHVETWLFASSHLQPIRPFPENWKWEFHLELGYWIRTLYFSTIWIEFRRKHLPTVVWMGRKYLQHSNGDEFQSQFNIKSEQFNRTCGDHHKCVC